jgi:tRNA-specific 2-thiouridylase
MIEGYRNGRTPNPDIMCNREIKFGAFAKWAIAQGADYVATGHYAENKITKKGFVLEMGKDANKDQTYFLWTLTQQDLKHILFPVGGMNKDTVRKLAAKFKLPTATKKDSQGICMLGAIDLKDFLKEFIQTKKGNVLDETGKVIGEHPGALLFTLGERHGFTITDKDSVGKIFYIISKDISKNTITVSTDPLHSANAAEKLEYAIENVNWIGRIPTVGEKLKARSRYRAPLVSCEVVNATKAKTLVRFAKPDVTASAGQSLVFYDGDICLGGGIIA